MKLTIMKNYIKLEWWEIIATRPATAKCALIVSVQYMTRHDYPVMNFDLVMNYHHLPHNAVRFFFYHQQVI